MTEIGLLRHGEVMGGSCFRGSTDDPLTDTGLQHMHQTLKDFSGYWQRIISSPLQRCAAFAEQYAQQQTLPVDFDKRFQEMHFGDWEGCTAAELYDKDPDTLSRFWADPFKNTPPGAEPLAQFQSRVLEAWQALVHNCQNQRVLLVTHGGVIRILLCHLQQYPAKSLLELEIPYASLFCFNSHEHRLHTIQEGFIS